MPEKHSTLTSPVAGTPVSPGTHTLAHRGTSGTMESSIGYETDEDTTAALTDAKPTDTTGVLLERLQAWKHACGYLENYVTATEKVNKAHAKEYDRVLKTISDPLKEGHHFDQSLGGIAGMFENMRTNTQALANLHGETAKNLNGTVLPILARLHKEIKAKAKELTDGAYKGAKTVETAQNTTQKWIESLGQHSAVFDSAGGKIEPVNDPYLLQRGIQYRLHKQVLEENNNRQDIISVQRNFEGFETHVVQTLQQAMGQFLQFVGGQADRQKAMYSDIVGTVQRIPPEFEWMNFLHRSGNLLIDPASPARDVKSITYANQTHASTKPLIAGTLERKSRALGKLGGYKTHYYAVTPAKYLHQFADDDNFRKDPAPELTLYLPDCTIGAVADTKFNIKGKDASKGKVGSYVQMNHELAFKAHTPSDAQQWHAIISKCSGTTTTEPPNSAITSPVTPTAPANPITGDKRVASNPPEYTDKQPAPLQIEGLPGQTTEQTTGVTSEDFAPQSTSTAATGAGTSAGATGAAPQSAGVLPSPTTPATTTTTSPDAAVLGKETAK